MASVRIVCFGSLNYDLAVRVPRLPQPDETLAAHTIEEFLGGKGANQATAAARLGAETVMIGCLGRDAHGDSIEAGLGRNGIDHAHVDRVEAPTGIAIPLVTDDGEVSIIIVAGANGVVDEALADAKADVLANADVLLLQGEVSLTAAARAAKIAKAAGVTVVFNPAPISPEAAEVLPHTSVVIVNRVEREALGLAEDDDRVIVTLGADGVLVDGEQLPAYPATTVDPTGAGDAFCAAFAVATADGMSRRDAAQFAAAAGAWAVGIAGAEPAMPTRADIAEVQGRVA